jgi:dsRNA-specific ribonuclease
LLADAYEAVLAAIYGDAGLAVAAQFVERSLIVPSMETKTETLHRADHKSVLQEWLQQQANGVGGIRGEPVRADRTTRKCLRLKRV